jgi:hypothetical protein
MDSVRHTWSASRILMDSFELWDVVSVRGGEVEYPVKLTLPHYLYGVADTRQPLKSRHRLFILSASVTRRHERVHTYHRGKRKLGTFTQISFRRNNFPRSDWDVRVV